MKINKLLLILLLLSAISGCYSPTGCYGPMTGTVVDAETGNPIEDAIVYVEWTVTTGLPGLKSANTYAVTEKVTDKNGKFTIVGVLNPMVNRPVVVVYKKGYVAWRSDYIFPDYAHRMDFEWKRNYIFRLDNYKNYSHSRHILFLRGGLSLASTKLEQAYIWEDPFASKEEELLRQKRQAKKLGTYTEKEMWNEIVRELYPQNEGATK